MYPLCICSGDVFLLEQAPGNVAGAIEQQPRVRVTE